MSYRQSFANKHSKDLDCTDFVNNYTEEAEKALEQWDKEQPEHTYKSALVEKFPHAFIDKVVKTTCPRTFYGDNAPSVGSCGNKCGAFKLCIKCWNQPYEEE